MKLRFYKVNQLPNRCMPNAIYFVKKGNNDTEQYVTSTDRVPHLVDSRDLIQAMIDTRIGTDFHIGDEPPEDTTKIWIDTSNI